MEFLINASWIEFLKTLDDEQAFCRLVWGIKGKKPSELDATRYEGVCPYRGLAAFQPEDEQFFFGRESLTGWLVSALRREVRATQGVRFLGVLGPSGSGKSSVVLAGLVPKLKVGRIDGSERWPVAILRPGDDPLKNLAAGVMPRFLPAGALADAAKVLKLIDDLHTDTRTLDVFAQMALHDQPEDVRLVVVVDQFEEVFTNRPQDDQARARFEQQRDQFFANLLQAAATPGGRVAVVLTMRSDFLSACAAFPQLAAVLSAHQEVIGPMTPAELREVIEQPAFRVGCEVEPGLTERLLADVKGQAGALPLLQFALTEVWKKREMRRLTLRAYTELGKDDKGEQKGIEGVLEHRANEIYGSLKAEDQDLCRRIFLRLVQPGEGTEDTKRRVSYRELLPDDPTRAEAVKRLVRTLADRDARLVTTEGTDSADGAVEVAHEALIRGWTQLRRWVDAERASLRTQRRLTEQAQEWAAAEPEHKEDYLYSGARLAVAREWVETHGGELSRIEAAFLAVSEEAERQRKQDEVEHERRLREAAEASREAERKHAEEADARKRDAEAAARRQKQLGSRFLAAAAAAAVLAVASGGLALWTNKARNDADIGFGLAKANEEEAKAQAKTSDSRRIAALSESERDKHLDRALLLAVEAVRTENTLEARNSLFRAVIARPGLTSFLHPGGGRVLSVAFSRDSHTLAAGYYSGLGGGVVLWDVARRARLAVLPLGVPVGDVPSVVFSPDGHTLAAGYVYAGSGGVVLWDVARRARLADVPLAVPEGAVRNVAFSADGHTLAAGYLRAGNGGVVLWDVEHRDRLAVAPLAVPEGGVSSVAFSRDGHTLAAGYYSGLGGGVVLWDVARRARLADVPLAVPEGAVRGVAFSADGHTLAAGYGHSGSGGVVVWDVEHRDRLAVAPLAVPEGNVLSVAFGPEGHTLAAGYSRGERGGVVLWDMDRRARLANAPLVVLEGAVSGVAVSRDGHTLAAGYRGGVVLWDVGDRARLADAPLAVPEGAVSGVAVSRDGHTLAAGYNRLNGSGRGVVLWDVGRRARLADAPLTVTEGFVHGVVFSPDGKILAASYNNQRSGGGVVLWEVGHRVRRVGVPLAVPEGGVSSVAISRDGHTLAAGYNRFDGRGGVVLWDVEHRDRLAVAPLAVPEGNVLSVVFSPDGKTLAAGYSNRRGRGGGVVLWGVGPWVRLAGAPLALPEGNVWSVAFSSDGETLAAGYFGGVALWDIGHRARLVDLPLAGDERGVFRVVFSPDDKTLAAGHGGGVVLWDMEHRARLADAPVVAEGEVGSVAFSPDGHTLASAHRHFGTGGGGVVLWDVDIDSWPRLARGRANRNLTRAEWRQYFPDTPYRPTFDDLPVPPEIDTSDAPASKPDAHDVPEEDPK
jgi:WD40 repeat protein